MIQIYTDGASRGNPGRGGFGVVMIYKQYRKEISKGFRLTTNNRMELLSVIVALETIKWENTEITVYSDSRYVVDSITKGWVFGWAKKNFKDKKNADLWQRFLKVYPKHKVKFVWVKAHANNVENNRCDFLAVTAADGKDLYIDKVFESNKDNDLFE